jgi:hypothetical protein
MVCYGKSAGNRKNYGVAARARKILRLYEMGDDIIDILDIAKTLKTGLQCSCKIAAAPGCILDI